MFAQTMKMSLNPLKMLLMLTSIAIVVCSSLMYFIERGRFNTAKGYWERPYRYQCDVAVRAGPCIPLQDPPTPWFKNLTM